MVLPDANAVWVMGHRNPDTDCTIAAIAYAALKQMHEDGDTRYIPVVLGPVNAETRVVLRRFGVPVPAELHEAHEITDNDTGTGTAQGTGARVILVDHSQKSQSVVGLDTAEVVEVIDHHNIGDVTTGAPIFFLADPVGATATLIAEMYLQPAWCRHLLHPERVVLDVATAGILLSAVISDTLRLRSPTTTARDRHVLTTLATRTGVDVDVLAEEMFAARSDISARSADDLVGNDYKLYTFGDTSVGVAQVDVLSLDAVRGRYGELLAALTAAKERQRLDIYLMMMTDIVSESTDLLFDAVSKPLVSRIFEGKDGDGYLHLPGVVSRKKQLIPPLAAHLS